jgi:hypothetical protein
MSDIESRLVRISEYREAKGRALVKIEPVPLLVASRPHLRPHYTRAILAGTAIVLAGAGIIINGWFAQSLGSTPIAGYLFLTVGVASDIAALVLPCAAAQLNRLSMRMLAWMLWLVTVGWALIASVGFVSVNVVDANAARSSPAVELARRIADVATVARQGECIKRGTLCREREADERRALSDLREARSDLVSDPQTAAASRLITWVSGGVVSPSGGDMALVRLLLLTFLPQAGGLLLLVARSTS